MKKRILVTIGLFVSALVCTSGCEQSSQPPIVESPLPAHAGQPLLVSHPTAEPGPHQDHLLPTAPLQLDVMYPDEIWLPWGNGSGEVGLLPPAEERIPQGPLSLAVDNDGSLWLLDQVNHRLVHLSPNGDWLGFMDSPPGATDLFVGLDGSLFVLSLINRRVTVIDSNGGTEQVQIPMALRHVAGILVDSRGHLLLTTAYENTYDLGVPGAWIPWPDLLHTVAEGLPGTSGGPRFRPLLHRDRAALLHRSSSQIPFETWILPDTVGAASVTLLDSKPDGSVVVLLEWVHDDGVERLVRLLDPDAGTIDEVELAPSPFTFPFREIAIGPSGVLHRLYSQPDGLTIENHVLGRAR